MILTPVRTNGRKAPTTHYSLLITPYSLLITPTTVLWSTQLKSTVNLPRPLKKLCFINIFLNIKIDKIDKLYISCLRGFLLRDSVLKNTFF